MLGIAAIGERGWFFVATDPRVEELYDTGYSDAATSERVARLVLTRSAAALHRMDVAMRRIALAWETPA